MRFIGNVIEKLQRHPKRVVFPEGMDVKVGYTNPLDQPTQATALTALGN